MKRPTPESLILRDCIQWLHVKKIFCWRNNSGSYKAENGNYIRYGFVGSSDIIGILPDGRFLGIECKAAKGKLTEHQEVFKSKVENSGGIYIMAKSVGELDRALSNIKPIDTLPTDM